MTLGAHEQATIDLMDKLHASHNPLAGGIIGLVKDLNLDIYSVDNADLFRSRLNALTKMYELELLYGTITLRQIQDNRWRLGLG